MKLYVWTGDNVLPNYGNGHAIAYAESIDEAQKLLVEKIHNFYDWLDPKDPDDAEFLRNKTAFLFNQCPVVYHGPVAFAIHGSE